jgi:hypothetical protein
VRAKAAEVIASNAGRQGHVFNLGHGVLPETDPTILTRLVEAVQVFKKALKIDPSNSELVESLVTALLWSRYSQLYSGEELGESDAPARRQKRSLLSPADDSDSFAFVPPQILAVFKKELRYLRRNTFLFFGLIFPPMMVLFFSVQFAGIHPTAFKKGLSPDVFFPAMMAYLVLILIAPSYNCFSYEGKGIQTYITSPVRFREVLIAEKALVGYRVVLLLMAALDSILNKSAIAAVPAKHVEDLGRIDDLRKLSPDISMMARVRILLRRFHHAGSHRIEVYGAGVVL